MRESAKIGILDSEIEDIEVENARDWNVREARPKYQRSHLPSLVLCQKITLEPPKIFSSCSQDTNVPTNLASISISSSLSSTSSSDPLSSITSSSSSQTVSETLGENYFNDLRDKTFMSLSMGH